MPTLQMNTIAKQLTISNCVFLQLLVEVLPFFVMYNTLCFKPEFVANSNGIQILEKRVL